MKRMKNQVGDHPFSDQVEQARIQAERDESKRPTLVQVIRAEIHRIQDQFRERRGEVTR